MISIRDGEAMWNRGQRRRLQREEWQHTLVALEAQVVACAVTVDPGIESR